MKYIFSIVFSFFFFFSVMYIICDNRLTGYIKLFYFEKFEVKEGLDFEFWVFKSDILKKDSSCLFDGNKEKSEDGLEYQHELWLDLFALRELLLLLKVNHLNHSEIDFIKEKYRTKYLKYKVLTYKLHYESEKKYYDDYFDKHQDDLLKMTSEFRNLDRVLE